MEIKKVRKRKDGTKTVIVPRHSDIIEGDYVKIIKVENDNSHFPLCPEGEIKSPSGYPRSQLNQEAISQ